MSTIIAMSCIIDYTHVILEHDEAMYGQVKLSKRKLKYLIRK